MSKKSPKLINFINDNTKRIPLVGEKIWEWWSPSYRFKKASERGIKEMADILEEDVKEITSA